MTAKCKYMNIYKISLIFYIFHFSRTDMIFSVPTSQINVVSTLQGVAILISFLVSAVFHEVRKFSPSLIIYSIYLVWCGFHFIFCSLRNALIFFLEYARALCIIVLRQKQVLKQLWPVSQPRHPNSKK